MLARRLVPLIAGAAFLASPPSVTAQQASLVYDRHSRAVAKVEVLEAISGARSSVGTAFFAAPSLLVTNYHVVRDIVFRPAAYTLRLLPTDGIEIGDGRIVALDPANDLAVLRVDRVHASPLRLTLDSVPNGEVLYSLGHPAALRTSIVEGVFNGPVSAAAAPLMHFSGPINPGMSGGPTLRANGEVVGINVSSAGDQLSFIIPALQAQELLDEAASIDPADDRQLLAHATRRLAEFQDDFFSRLVSGGLDTMRIGSALLPAAPADRFDCSADPHEIEGGRYELIEYRCHTEDRMLLGPKGSYDLIYMEHLHMSSESLPLLAFHNLLSQWHGSVQEWEAPENDDATRFGCRRGNVAKGRSAEVLVVFCVRRHLSHQPMYELFVRSTLLGGAREGVVSTLRATPISFPRAIALTRSWLRGFSWTR